jgi:hypothetical protein
MELRANWYLELTICPLIGMSIVLLSLSESFAMASHISERLPHLPSYLYMQSAEIGLLLE